MRSLLISLLISTLCFAGEMKLGQPLTLDKPMSISQVMAKADKLSGKTVQVKGKVTEVCKMMGCWMALVDPKGTQSLRIKVNDGVIVIPKEAIGKMAVAEGSLTKLQLTKEQAIGRAKHEAEEQGRSFDASKITSGQTIYQIQGNSIVIQN